MVSKVFNILKSIGINAYYQECTNPSDEYVIYSIYQEKDTEIADNISQATMYFITLNYWYSKDNKKLRNRYKEIKNVMKSNGFKVDGCVDRIGETHYGKNMNFIIKEWNA